MQATTTIGLDIAKSVFQVHGIDRKSDVHLPSSAQASLRAGLLPETAAVPGWYRSLRLIASLVARTPSTSSRCCRLMPPAYVKPHVKRHRRYH